MAGRAEGERKLAAILSADVAGYSRLMEDDEAATVRTLTEYRQVFRDYIERHRGRVVDAPGDNLMAEFASPVEAVGCAVEVQRELSRRNRQLADHRRMDFRVGINLGDVLERDGALFGTGVNIAARMEALAEPGAICVSGTVHEHVGNALDVAFEDLGEQAVKNIARPVRCYRVRSHLDAAARGPAPRTDTPSPLTDKPSIAVLPFSNMSGDPEQDYFADGISEDIITDLSKASGLLVIARNSSFAYKGRAPTMEQVSRELGVAYVLEGSVRKAGGRVRINAQLIDAATGHHMWADRYDRDLDDIFEVQDDVTRRIVAALKVHLSDAEQEALSAKGTANLDAYDCYLRAREAYNTFSSRGNVDARAWLDKALALDPRFADARALLSQGHVTDYVNRWSKDWEESLRIGRQHALKAVATDDGCAHAHHSLGTVYLWSGDPDRTTGELERAIALDPNFAPSYIMLAMALHYAGDSRDALTQLSTARRLDPYRPNFILHYEALCYFMLGDYQRAAEVLRDRIERFPETDISRALLASAQGHLGKIDEAQATWSALMEINPDYSFAQRRKILPYRNPDDPARIAEGLRKAGLDIPDGPASQ